MTEYKITGECVFGTREMGADGKMKDESQFRSSNYKDYIDNNHANLATQVAVQYGAKPISTLEYKNYKIEVYNLLNNFGVKIIRADGSYCYPEYTIRNTASPMALCKLADDMYKGYDELGKIRERGKIE